MYRAYLLILFVFLSVAAISQRLVTYQEAVNLSLQNKINGRPSTLALQQQQQLLKATGGLDNPEVELEQSPYEGLLLGIQQRLRLPGVYANQKALQKERIQLARLMIRLNENEIKRLVRNTFLQLQYLTARSELLTSQDSLYQAIKTAAKRNFDAGQINKLQELFAANEADKVRNELNRNVRDLQTRKIVLGYLTNLNDNFNVEPLSTLSIDSLHVRLSDSTGSTLQQQLLQQQVNIAQQELKVQKGEALPELTAGPLFPLSSDYKQAIGYRLGISVPLWVGQNRARVNAAKTGIELAEAQRQREMRNISREYQVAYSNLVKEQTSLTYYNTIALDKSKEIIETALRLFAAGQMDYIEALRNIITAFETKVNYLETLRNFNEALIELKFLNGTL
ncbi:MAG TPA: TolC family protein [Chitinophagaceae bacterium]|nr:TolC family protein [Chitinophagaceae bacterium]